MQDRGGSLVFFALHIREKMVEVAYSPGMFQALYVVKLLSIPNLFHFSSDSNTL